MIFTGSNGNINLVLCNKLNFETFKLSKFISEEIAACTVSDFFLAPHPDQALNISYLDWYDSVIIVVSFYSVQSTASLKYHLIIYLPMVNLPMTLKNYQRAFLCLLTKAPDCLSCHRSSSIFASNIIFMSILLESILSSMGAILYLLFLESMFFSFFWVPFIPHGYWLKSYNCSGPRLGVFFTRMCVP